MSAGLREVRQEDLPALHAIYSFHVLHGLSSFDETPPRAEAFHENWVKGRRLGMPWLAVEDESGVCGYAYAAPFRPRSAYRFTVEDSIYVAEAHRGQGLGRLLLNDLLRRCEDIGMRQVIAVIGDSGNTASIGLHLKAGFEHAGLLSHVGFKAQRWLDVVFMQKALGDGHLSRPCETA